MKNRVNFLYIGITLLLIACGSSKSSDNKPDTLNGSWYIADSVSGIMLKLKDGRYETISFKMTGRVSADYQREAGTYTADSSNINFSPEYYSCPELPGPKTWQFKKIESSLSVTSGPVTYILKELTTGAPVNSIVITESCFLY